MDSDGRRTSYSMARVLEEVQQQKTKEQQLRRSLLAFELSPELAAAAAASRNTEEELPFQPGFVSHLLGKFGGPAAAPISVSVGAGLSKAASIQNLATAAGASVSGGGVLLRHPECARVGAGNGIADSPRRRSQDALATTGVLNGNGVTHDVSDSISSPTSSQSPSSPSSASVKLPPAAGKDRVLIIAKASAPPVVRRQQQQQQQQQHQRQQPQQSAQMQVQVAPIPPQTAAAPPTPTPSLTPTAVAVFTSVSKVDVNADSASFVFIPSDASLPIKNIVQAKRNMFEHQQQQAAAAMAVASHQNGGGGGGNRTHSQQPFVGRSVTRQILPRTVEIVNVTTPRTTAPMPPMSATMAQPFDKAAVATTILPSWPANLSTTFAPVKKPTIASATASNPAPSPSFVSSHAPAPILAPSTTPGTLTNGDAYGYGLPVPQLKSSLPFNGENLKRVQLSERAVAAMRKAGKSWFFGTDVSTAPEGTIAVKLTPSRHQSGVIGEDDDYRQTEQDDLTEERRAQTTVWDHVRSAESSDRRLAVDPALEAEARRLMMSSGADAEAELDDDATDADASVFGGDVSVGFRIAVPTRVRKSKKNISFKRDSALEETYEYQSEQSLIEELQITPDYSTDPFDLGSPQDSEEETAAAAGHGNSPPPGPAANAVNPAATSSLASYKAKLADDFVWGAHNANEQPPQPEQRHAVADVDFSDGSVAPVDDPDAQWSASSTTDLLF